MPRGSTRCRISGGGSPSSAALRSRSLRSAAQCPCRWLRRSCSRRPTRSSCFRSASTCLLSGGDCGLWGGGSWPRLADTLPGERDRRQRRQPEDAPGHRVLEERVVEEAVDPDRGEDDTEDQRDTPCETRRDRKSTRLNSSHSQI